MIDQPAADCKGELFLVALVGELRRFLGIREEPAFDDHRRAGAVFEDIDARRVLELTCVIRLQKTGELAPDAFGDRQAFGVIGGIKDLVPLYFGCSK